MFQRNPRCLKGTHDVLMELPMSQIILRCPKGTSDVLMHARLTQGRLISSSGQFLATMNNDLLIFQIYAAQLIFACRLVFLVKRHSPKRHCRRQMSTFLNYKYRRQQANLRETVKFAQSSFNHNDLKIKLKIYLKYLAIL